MDVLLINPPCVIANPVLPLGLASIVAVLEKNDVNVGVIDAWASRLDFKELGQEIAHTNPKIIGITMMSPNYADTKRTIEVARSSAPFSKIIVGGPHPSALPKETLEEIPDVDFAIVGEGEVTMLELVNAIGNGKNFEEIAGLAFRNNNSIVMTSPRMPVSNLDSLPTPARYLFPIDKYRFVPPYGRNNPSTTMVTSRGCPFGCIYCSKDVFKNNYRAISPSRVVDEIEQLIEKYKAREIRFYDDDFTLDMKRADQICEELLRRDIKISWTCTTRVDLVDEELLKKMKKSGCWMISYGVESGVQEILDKTKKGFTIEQIKRSFEWTKKAGIRILGYFMLGLPGETKEMIQRTIDFSIELEPDFANYSILVIYPGSTLYKEIRNGKYGKLESEQLIHLSFTAPNSSVFPVTRQSATFVGDFTIEDLEYFLTQAYKKFYLRFSYIFKQLQKIKSFSEWFYYGSSGINLLQWLLKSSNKKGWKRRGCHGDIINRTTPNG